MDETTVIKTIADLGTSAILLYFIYELWKDKRDKDSQVRETIKEKDAHIEMINQRILDVVKENTKSQVELRESIKANTESSNTLTSKIYDLLTKK